MDFFSKFFDFLKLPFKIIAYIALLTGILFFFPGGLRSYFELTGLYQNYGQWIGLSFIVSCSYFLFILLIKVAQKIICIIEQNKREHQIQDYMNSLSKKEIIVLREFVLQGSDTITVNIEDVGVSSLLKKGILSIVQKSSQVWIFGRFVNVSLSQEAIKFYTLGQLSLTDNISESEKNKIMSERPDFVFQIDSINNLKKNVADPFLKYKNHAR